MTGSRWTSREVLRGSVKLNVRDTGTDEARSVVLLTGLGTSQRVWDRVARQLVDRYRVITFDYRGHGRSSPAADYSFEAFLQDLQAVLDDTSPSQTLLCGWSFGADLAIWYAADHPEAYISGLLAVDGGIPADSIGRSEDQLRKQLESPVARTTGRITRMFGAGVQLTSDEVLALIRAGDQRRATITDAYARLHIQVSVALASRPTRSPDSERALQIWRSGAEKLAVAQPDVSITWIDSDHAIPLRRPDQVAQLIDALACSAP